ncbi:MAG: hypothetical protein ACUVWZ_12960, partial [Anaerolineae bacterium]
MGSEFRFRQVKPLTPAHRRMRFVRRNLPPANLAPFRQVPIHPVGPLNPAQGLAFVPRLPSR